MFLSRIGSSAITSYTVDTDVQTYLNAVKTAGGSYDGITLDALNQFVIGLKNDGLWSLCDEIGIFAGIQIKASLNPILIKLKSAPGSVSSAANTGFVAANYQSTGPYTGLSGNGNSKNLQLGFNPTTMGTMLSTNLHMMVYVDGPERDTSVIRFLIGSRNSSFVDRRSFIAYSTLSGINYGAAPYGTSPSSFANGAAPNPPAAFYPSTPQGPSLMLSLTGDLYTHFYTNGVEQTPPGYQGTSPAAFYNGNFLLFTSNDGSVAATQRSTRVIRGYSYGQGMPTVSAARYSYRWNTLMNTFGASALNTSF